MMPGKDNYVLSMNLCIVGIAHFVYCFLPSMGKTEDWILITAGTLRFSVASHILASRWCRLWPPLCQRALNCFSTNWFQRIMGICRPPFLEWKVVQCLFAERTAPFLFTVILCWLTWSACGMRRGSWTSPNLMTESTLPPLCSPVLRWRIASLLWLWETTIFAGAKVHLIWAIMSIWWWICLVETSTSILVAQGWNVW